MKHIFIINRISGKGNAYKLIDLIEKIAKEKALDYEINVTEYPGHAQKNANDYQKKDDVIIYAVGGDGTILEVVNGINKDVPLAIIPAGSGNDFYRVISDDYKKDRKKSITKTIDAETQMIDYGISSNLRFINCTSFGIDADINYDASKLIRKTFLTKGVAYILSIIKHIIFLKTKTVSLIVDGKKINGEYYIVAIMNGKYYGNGVKACPQADIQDGYLDLCLLEKLPKYKAYPFIFKYLKGKHENHPAFKVIRCKHVIVDSDKELSCQSDGENYTSKHIDIRIVEKGLKLKIPN